MNGSIWKVIDIVYDDPRGRKVPGTLPFYVVFDFPESTLSHILIPGISSTHIKLQLLLRGVKKDVSPLPQYYCEYVKLLPPTRANELLRGLETSGNVL